ncbi:MAG: hypothetical protein IPQ13_00800 [Holophagaceae bacterium]|nr:hypothetical protein [Holophagaceae bacterium]
MANPEPRHQISLGDQSKKEVAKRFKNKTNLLKRRARSIERKTARRRAIHKARRKELNLLHFGVSKEEAREDIKLMSATRRYERVEAPEVFSFNENPEGVIQFINKLENLFIEKRKTCVMLKKIKTIDYGAIVSLLSIMVQFKAKNIKFNGNIPKNENTKNILIKSGFFKNLALEFKDEDQYQINDGGKNEIITHAGKLVDSELGDAIIQSASKTIWGEERRCQGVQRVLIELMMNTNNHAANRVKGEKHWWLHVNHDEQSGIVGFAFVDFGVGIFKSLNDKPNTSKFYNYLSKIAKLLKHGDNAEILKLMLNGEFHQTVTGKYFRGKGLPGIADVQKRNQITSLKIVTNDAYASLDDDVFQKLDHSFSGTYVYWEIRRDNGNCK